MTIPNRIIEGIYNTELKAADYYDIYGKENIENALFEIQKSNMEILNKYTPEAMKEAVSAKLNKKNILSFKSYKIISYAAAAIFVAAIALPVSFNSFKAKTPSSTERLKGPAPVTQETKLFLYRQKGKEIHALADGDFARSGDVLQITYQAGSSEYGIIFSIDGNGNLTRHFPENNWTAAKLKHGSEEIPLDFSYELDNAPDFEYFIMVSSQEQFTLDNLDKKIKNKTDLEYLSKLNFIPKNTTTKTFLIEK